MSKRGFNVAHAPDKPRVRQTSQRTPARLGQTPSWRLLGSAFLLFKRNPITVSFVVILPSILLQLGTSLVAGFRLIDGWTWLGISLEIVGGLLLVANIAAPYLMQSRIVQGKQPGIWEVYRDSFRFIPRVVGFGLLFAFLLLGGLLMLVVPGLILLRRYFLTIYFLIDGDLGIREAMQRSATVSKLIKRHIWSMFVILVAFVCLNIGLVEWLSLYGQFVAILLPAVYLFLPALRYQEAKRLLRATTIEQ